MSIVIMQTFKAAEGRYEDLARVIAAMLPDTAARPGAEFVHAAGDPASATVTVYQQWDCEKNQRDYAAWRATTDVSPLMALLGGAPKIEQLSQLF